MSTIPVRDLGQAGLRFSLGSVILYTDPYFSHSVEALDGPEMRRQVPLMLKPEEVRDADWVLISHAHIDHCDPDTLPGLAKASPQARFICPHELRPALIRLGIGADRIVVAEERWMDLSAGVRVHPVPAIHPRLERDGQGHLRFLGYVIEHAGRRIYFAGDTSVDEHLLAILKGLGPIDAAFLPVNERNFFRDRRGIIGNMTVREAFLMSKELGVRTLVPIHWDMFAPNSVYPEEIALVYERMKDPFALGFEMKLKPAEI